MTSAPSDRIADAIRETLTEISENPDPVERERAIRHIAETVLPEATRTVKAARRATVEELRTGRSLRKVGEMLGGLSIARVDQILKGK